MPAYNPSAPKERGIGLQLMSVQGPHAREVEDLRLALKVMSANGKGDPWWTPLKYTQSDIKKPLNIAVNKWCGNTTCNKEVVDSIDKAASIFSNHGFNVVEKIPPGIEEAAESWRTIFGIDAKINMLELVKESGSQDIINVVQGFVDAADGKGIKDYNDALSSRNKVLRSWNYFMDDFPIIISPVSACLPYKQGEDQLGKERFARILEEQSPLYVINFLGLPSVSVPINVKNNIPSGIQIITPRYYESLALDMAKIIEDEIGIFYKNLW